MNSEEAIVVWFTGMSGSGKSTLSSALKCFYLKKKSKVYVFDGDEVRAKDKKALGFGHKDVMKNNLRIAHLCKQKRKYYDVILVPVISPYNNVRLKVRSILEPDFHLIYLKSDLLSLRDRDPKGLYSAADKGLINDLIGYSDRNSYEVPEDAELVVETSNCISIVDSTNKLFDYLLGLE